MGMGDKSEAFSPIENFEWEIYNVFLWKLRKTEFRIYMRKIATYDNSLNHALYLLLNFKRQRESGIYDNKGNNLKVSQAEFLSPFSRGLFLFFKLCCLYFHLFFICCTCPYSRIFISF